MTIYFFIHVIPLSKCILSSPGQAVKLAAWSLRLAAFFFHNFFSGQANYTNATSGLT